MLRNPQRIARGRIPATALAQQNRPMLMEVLAQRRRQRGVDGDLMELSALGLREVQNVLLARLEDVASNLQLGQVAETNRMEGEQRDDQTVPILKRASKRRESWRSLRLFHEAEALGGEFLGGAQALPFVMRRDGIRAQPARCPQNPPLVGLGGKRSQSVAEFLDSVLGSMTSVRAL